MFFMSILGSQRERTSWFKYLLGMWVNVVRIIGIKLFTAKKWHVPQGQIQNFLQGGVQGTEEWFTPQK